MEELKHTVIKLNGVVSNLECQLEVLEDKLKSNPDSEAGRKAVEKMKFAIKKVEETQARLRAKIPVVYP